MATPVEPPRTSAADCSSAPIATSSRPSRPQTSPKSRAAATGSTRTTISASSARLVRSSLDVVGAYHSHPRSAAVPSADGPCRSVRRIPLRDRRPRPPIRRKSRAGPGRRELRRRAARPSPVTVRVPASRRRRRAQTDSPFRAQSRGSRPAGLGRAGPRARAVRRHRARGDVRTAAGRTSTRLPDDGLARRDRPQHSCR